MRGILESLLLLTVVPLLGAAIIAAIAAPVARRRLAAGAPSGWAWRSAIGEVGVVLGTLPSLLLILVPVSSGRNLRPVPFRDIAELLSEDVGYAVLQIGGNLLVFAAFGALAPLRWRIGLPTVLVIACLSSTALEVLQYLLDTGRFTSFDDVLLNTLGAGIAARLSRRWWRLRLNDAAGQSADHDRTPGQRTPR